MSMLYLLYIDDISMIWKGIYEYLTNLCNFNKQQPTIKFDFVISIKTV